MLKTVLVPVHSAGWPFIVLFASVGILMTWMFAPLGFVGLVLTTWCIYFFRDPPRVTPDGDGLVISPADGVVQSIVQAAPPAELEMGPEPRTRIAVFMNVFNVHVNRIPITGTISATAYRPGKFFNASFDPKIDGRLYSPWLSTSHFNCVLRDLRSSILKINLGCIDAESNRLRIKRYARAEKHIHFPSREAA